MSFSEYARYRRKRDLRGGSAQSVSKAVKAGRLDGALYPDGTINAEVADRLWEQNTGRQGEPARRRRKRETLPSRPPMSPPSLPPQDVFWGDPEDDPEEPGDEEYVRPRLDQYLSLEDARRIHEIEKARLARAKADEAEGRSVAVVEVQRRWAEMGVVLRTRMMAIPSRMPELSHEELQHLTDEVVDALTALADEMDPRGAEAPEETH